VTSGNVSPSLGTPIGMAYVPNRLAEPGTEIAVEIRGKAVPARVVTLPFYAHKTKKIAAPGTPRS
jgi:aminomethyltransferase